LVASSGGKLPENFAVTFPKIVTPEQVTALIDVFDELEPQLGLAPNTLKMEMMIRNDAIDRRSGRSDRDPASVGGRPAADAHRRPFRCLSITRRVVRSLPRIRDAPPGV
jgi:hypothetical protein